MPTFYDQHGQPCKAAPPKAKLGLQRVLELGRAPNLKPDFAIRRDDLAVMTCFFNPVGFQTLRRHYDAFAQRCEREGVKLWTIECAIGDQDHSIPKHDRVFHVRSRDILWHKERLLNILAEKIPEEFTKLAWVDCDFEFDQGDWWEQAAVELEHKPVVQLFNQLTYLDRQGKPCLQRRSASAELAVGGKFWQCCPGGAWAAHREFFRHYGLFDRLINGGGDSLAFHAFHGSLHPPLMSLYNAKVRACFQKWAKPVYRYMRGQIGCLNVAATHHWHGDRKNRGYNDRITMIRDFDPENDLEASPDQAWQWRDSNSPLASRFADYFCLRDEDGRQSSSRGWARTHNAPALHY